MMTRLYSSTVLGVEGVEVEVEVDFRPMAEKRTFIVGLPDTAVKESGQRVDTAVPAGDFRGESGSRGFEETGPRFRSSHCPGNDCRSGGEAC